MSFVNTERKANSIGSEQRSHANLSRFTEYSDYSQYYDEASIRISNEPPKRDMRKEMVSYFYSAMVQYIIEKKELKIKESVPSIASAERILIGQPFKETEPITMREEREVKETKLFINHFRRQIRASLLKKKSIRLSKKRQERTSKHSKIKKSHITSRKSIYPKYLGIDCMEENVKIEFQNGNIYEGTIYCNRLHGEGKYTWSNGTVYEGQFKNNEITGVGRFQYPDQSIYTGEVYKKYCHGTGILYSPNSPGIYEGEFHLNMKHGVGWQLFDNDNTYDGEWADDLMNGNGIRRYPSGALYNGKFIMGKRDGHGVAVMKNHDVYSGEWVQGERDGFGDYIWNVPNEHYLAVPVNSCYYGSWVKNKRDGIGVINFGLPGGSRYAGYFSNNEKHGSGVIICENGHVIESEPLFINDKPVHVTDSGNVETSRPLNSTELLSSSDEQTSSSCKTYFEDINRTTRKEKLLIRFPLDKKLPYASQSSEKPSTPEMIKKYEQNKNNSDIYDTVFPKIMDHYSSLKIPIGVSSELIDLNALIYKIIEYKSNIHNYYKHKYNAKVTGSCTYRFVSQSSFDETYSDYDFHKSEERRIRKTIARYLRQLRRIYYQYAKLGCFEENPNIKTWLMRIFFWQLYRDCKIPEKGISLIDIDLMLSEKSTFDFYVVHNPFEIIYFWQFLESLLHVALKLYGHLYIFSVDGVLKQSFEFLMENDILPNAGHFSGSALFEYKDVLPLKAAYAWYKSFGEPHTAKEFYANICIIKHQTKQNYTKETLDVPYIKFGKNAIQYGNKILYLEDEDLDPSKAIPPKIECVQHENTKKLYFLNDLKPVKIINFLISICPSIRLNQDIINFEYKLSFLEFYEVILLCTQAKVKMRNEYLSRNTIEYTSFLKKRKRMTLAHRKSKKAQG